MKNREKFKYYLNSAKVILLVILKTDYFFKKKILIDKK